MFVWLIAFIGTKVQQIKEVDKGTKFG